MARHVVSREPMRLPGLGMVSALLAVGLTGPVLVIGAEVVRAAPAVAPDTPLALDGDGASDDDR
jgi:hypothetical protein